jgi:hypothetical protein
MHISTDGIAPETTDPRRPRWVTALLVILPLWLIASGIGAMWYYFIHEEKMERESQTRFARAVSEPMLADDLDKIVTLIGERNTTTEAAGIGLMRAASMIEGTLGPSNTGYKVRRERTDTSWPMLVVTLEGRARAAPALWVVTSYDSPPGSAGAEANASGVAATLAAAQAVANDQPAINIHFAFLPHANDPSSPVFETTERLTRLMGDPSSVATVLSVEAMGAGESLWLSSTAPDPMALNLAEGLGEIRQPATSNPDSHPELAETLSQLGFPAIRVSTRAVLTPDEADDAPPASATLAASAGRLIELIRRCATSPQ